MNDVMVVDVEARELAIRTPPAEVLAQAKEAAVALKDVLDAKPNKVTMGGEVYLEFEDWQTIGKFYGLTVKVTGTRPITFGEAMGFEADAVVLHTASGQEVSRAEAMCLNDEEKWSSRPKYDYAYVLKSGGTSMDDPGKDNIVWIDNPKKPGGKMPKREKIRVGDDKVPLFQLRSMAQTRACAKAFRNVLAWVVVLAGYKPTPAEELPEAKTTPNEIEYLEARAQPADPPAEPPPASKAPPSKKTFPPHSLMETKAAQSTPAEPAQEPKAPPTLLEGEAAILVNCLWATQMGKAVLRGILSNYQLADKDAMPTDPAAMVTYVEELREAVDRVEKRST